MRRWQLAGTCGESESFEKKQRHLEAELPLREIGRRNSKMERKTSQTKESRFVRVEDEQKPKSITRKRIIVWRKAAEEVARKMKTGVILNLECKTKEAEVGHGKAMRIAGETRKFWRPKIRKANDRDWGAERSNIGERQRSERDDQRDEDDYRKWLIVVR